MNTLNCTVRMDAKNKELVLFYLDERNDLVCFTKSEGHSSASYGYYLKTDYVRESFSEHKQAVDLVEFYNSIDPDNDCKFKLVKRLTRTGE